MTNTPLNILVVEDSEDDTLLILRALERGGYNPNFKRVETSHAMKSELEAKKWDIIIADYKMPHFSGIKALELYKQTTLDIPFIIVSGAIGEETAVSTMKAGAHDFIMKDNLSRLVPAIERELREVKIRHERKVAEEEKEKIKVQLLQAQRMEAIGRLTGGVAHDFNNLLTAIRGYTDMAILRSNVDNPLLKELKEIKIAAERAMNLTHQLLLFSRRQPMKFTALDLNETIVNLLGILHRLIGEDIKVHHYLSSGNLTIYADKNSIEQMIVNLVVNARDAMDEGGDITVKSEKITLDDKDTRTMTEARPGQFILFSITDTGVGMDQETKEHIFEPFYSTKEFGKGSGLGLSVVYGIIKEHKGWINVISKKGEGSTFEVYLPLISGKPKQESTEEFTIKSYQGKGERILVIEDEDNVRHFTSRALRNNGYIVYTASDYNQAMELFKKEKGHFHLVFSDVVLPDISGIKLVENIQSSDPKIKVLLTSGYTDQKSQWKEIKDKNYPFLQKPYNMRTLLIAVRNVMEDKK